jgi:catechol 2,3-dioxygenase-like lactoylglutathione lyase family enzyme
VKLDRAIIKTANYQDSFAFYHDILGLKLKTSWQRKDSWGALFFCGDVLLEIIWYPDGEGEVANEYSREFSKIDLYLSVSNVDALHNRLSGYENLQVSNLENKPWGHRVFWVHDPDHVRIVFSQPI